MLKNKCITVFTEILSGTTFFNIGNNMLIYSYLYLFLCILPYFACIYYIILCLQFIYCQILEKSNARRYTIVLFSIVFNIMENILLQNISWVCSPLIFLLVPLSSAASEYQCLLLWFGLRVMRFIFLFHNCLLQVNKVLRNHHIKPHWMFAMDNIIRRAVQAAVTILIPGVQVWNRNRENRELVVLMLLHLFLF